MIYLLDTSVCSALMGRQEALKWQSARRGIAMSENDLWIATTALGVDATLVAADRDFGRLPGLRVEDWTQ